MKSRTILFALAACALLVACEKKISERESLDKRETIALDVQYALGGTSVQSLAFSHEYGRYELEVRVNNEGLQWDLASDQDWCRVVPGTHRGPGFVTLEIASNDAFVDRDRATLTFKAGEFKGFRISVDQSASAFIIGQPFFLSGRTGGDYAVNVTTLEGVDWTIEPDEDWLSCSTVSSATSGGQVTTALKLSAEGNTDNSRAGSFTLRSGNSKDVIRIWQFGTDLAGEGDDIFFAADEKASFSIVTPHSAVTLKPEDQPDFVTWQTESVEESLDKLTFTFAEHLSDCAEIRDTTLKLTLNKDGHTAISLPRIKQGYNPAYGLVTAKGMKLFAQKVAAGESTAEWENDEGWITMLRDIDMSGVTDWSGIGTQAHPFAGKFNGKNHSFVNFKHIPCGLFEWCEGPSETNPARIQNVRIAQNSDFYFVEENWSGDGILGGIVSRAVNTQISGCSNFAGIEFAGKNTGNASLWLGGIIGKGAEGVTVLNCRTEKGGITVSTSGQGKAARIGGIAAQASYVRGCTTDATVVCNTPVDSLYFGGAVPVIAAGSNISDNSFLGDITIKNSCAKIYVGGLYAVAKKGSNFDFDFASDRSSVSGSISLDSYKADATGGQIFLGGFIGFADQETTLSFKGYMPKMDFSFKHTGKAVSTQYCCCGNILGGCNPAGKASFLKFENITSQGTTTFTYAPLKSDGKWDGDNKSGVVNGCYGGVAGFINGKSSFTSCTNMGKLGLVSDEGAARIGGSENSSLFSMGGIVGYAEGGNLDFVSCKNEKDAEITNMFYNNNIAISTSLDNRRGQCAGGIIGAFNLKTNAGEDKMTASDCTNRAGIAGFRGFTGGIAAFCQGATLSSCQNTSKAITDNNNAFVAGGIAGCIRDADVIGCTVKTDIRAGAGGSADKGCPGGIVGRVWEGDEVTVQGCFYYGIITGVGNIPTSGDPKEAFPGGIVGVSCASTSIINCSYGGTITKTTVNPGTEDVTNNNVERLVIGTGGGSASGTTVWEGI